MKISKFNKVCKSLFSAIKCNDIKDIFIHSKMILKDHWGGERVKTLTRNSGTPFEFYIHSRQASYRA